MSERCSICGEIHQKGEICPKLLNLINVGVNNISKQIVGTYGEGKNMWKKNFCKAQCLLRAMIKNVDREEIFPIAIYKNNPAIYKTNKITGYALTDKSYFGKVIQNTLSERKREFIYDGCTYIILSAHTFNTRRGETSKSSRAFFSSESKVPIYVSSKINCDDIGHDTEEMIGHAKNKKTNKEVSFTVTYCYNCDKFYVLDVIVEKLLNMHILIDACLLPDVGDGSSFGRYDEQSILRANGYTVSSHSRLTTEMRHDILSNIIDCGLMTRNQIIYHLRGLIELRLLQYSKDFSLAISKWENDIEFVATYETPDQLDVYGEIIQ